MPAEPTNDFFTRARTFIDLTRRKRALEAEIAVIEKDLEKANAALINDFAKGAQSVKIDGMTVFLHRQTWAAYPEGRPAAIAALEASGLAEEYVKPDFNHQSLSKLVRELDPQDGGDGFPPEWEGKIAASEKFSIRGLES